jgi:hypothetical protein
VCGPNSHPNPTRRCLEHVSYRHRSQASTRSAASARMVGM